MPLSRKKEGTRGNIFQPAFVKGGADATFSVSFSGWFVKATSYETIDKAVTMVHFPFSEVQDPTILIGAIIDINICSIWPAAVMTVIVLRW